MESGQRQRISELPTPVQFSQQAEILAALERIRVSQIFANSEKLFQFLEFVVSATLRGEGGGLKETTIGVGFYHRDPSYDPKRDSIVRTQAARLRDRLEEYYRTEGAQDPLIIRLNRGSYVPAFDEREAQPPAENAEPQAVAPETRPVLSIHARARWRTILGVAFGLALLVAGLLWVQSARQLKVENYIQLTHDGRPKWLLGTDGVRLFIGIGSIFTPELAETSVKGGDIVPIPLPRSGLRPLALSANGGKLLLSEYYPANLWSFHLPGGELVRLGEAVGEEAAWSADGSRLAYRKAQELWVAASDGSGARKLVSVPNRRLYGLEWSPDGTRLRFTIWHSDEKPSLWEVSADGSNLHQLLPGWHRPPHEEEGRWTRDGRYYLFQSQGQIWALREHRYLPSLGADQPIRLTNSPLKMASPLPGRDGNTLYAVGRTERGNLVRYNAVTRSFEPYLAGISAEYVDFSRDGEWVAYVTYPDGVLWKSRKDGRDRLRLTSPPVYPWMPRWSPDGRAIAFSVRSSGGIAQSYSLPVGGGEAEQLFREYPAGLHDASWSPDGSRMVLSFDKNGPPGEVWLTGLARKDPVMIPGGSGHYWARWSPDGRHIVAMKQYPVGLSLFDLQTGKWSELATINGSFPSWSHDGKYVYFLRFPEHPAVVRIDIASRKVETVVDLNDLHMTGLMSAWLGLTPDDSPLLLRDAGTQDVYALELSE